MIAGEGERGEGERGEGGRGEGGRDGGGKDERSDWRRIMLCLRCVCFGCTGKDQEIANFADCENERTFSTPESNSLHLLKDPKKRETIPLEICIMPASTSKPSSCDYSEIHRRDSLADEDSSSADDVITKAHQSLPLSKGNQPPAESTTCNTSNQLQPMTTTTTTTAMMKTTKDQQVHLDLQYLTQAFKMLDSAHLWSFNIFKLNYLTNGRSLYHVTLHLFHRCDFLRTFGLDVDRLMHCVTLIESSYYFSNPYHNSVHAADVVQAMFVHLSEPQLESTLKPVERMAAVLSAACHDVDHRGTNQGFLIATSNPLCTLYNNVSILENHHWRSTIGILQEARLFEHLDKPTWLKIKDLIQTMILATDITQQAAILSVFRDYLNGNELKLSSDEQHRSFILQITLKCADISNPCRQWQLSKCWSELICEEFFRQGDRERHLGLPVTQFCDRTRSTIAKIQTGFMTHVAEPLFIEWNRFIATNNSLKMLENLRNNRSEWESIAKQEDVKVEILPVAENQHEDIRSGDVGVAISHRPEMLENGNSLRVTEYTNLGLNDDQIGWNCGNNPTKNPAPYSCQYIRRISLPTSDCHHHPNFFSLLSRLAPVFESLYSSEEPEGRSVSKEVRRCSIEDKPSSSTLRTNRINDEKSKKQDSESSVQKHIDYTEEKTQEYGSLPPTDFNGRWRMARKMSLISPSDHPAVTVIIGRKRSQSLVTSTIACAFEDDFGNFQNKEVSSVQSVVISAGKELWTTWWQKKSKNNFFRAKISQPRNSDTICLHREDNIVGQHIPVNTSLSNNLTHTTPTVQLLTQQCPILVSRVLEMNFRAAKGASRKTTSMFTTNPATGDAESVPLLEPSGVCVWNSEI